MIYNKIILANKDKRGSALTEGNSENDRNIVV